ncbi:IS1595 family transposase [Dongia sp.]|uniref:IS1595 family transposase n=1 Tax=Dongia sp. TaxID=1977262 RepID=UPI0035B2B002
MGQHFLLSTAARELSVHDVACMQERTAYNWFLKARWGEGKPACPECGRPNAYNMTRQRFRCSDVHCRRDFTATSGTVFASRKLSFKKILLALLLSANSVKGKAALQLSREIDISYKSAWVLLMKIREAISMEREWIKLSGVVEIDGMHINPHIRKENKKEDNETPEAKEKRKNIREQRHRLVMGLRARGGRTVTAITTSENARDASSLVTTFVDEDAVVVSDQNRAYDSLALLRKTERTDHSKHYVGENKESTNQIESFFSRARRSMKGIHHRMSDKYRDWYMAELAWREDMRRKTNKWQTRRFLESVLWLPQSRHMTGYWQGNKLPGEIIWNSGG